MADGSGGCGQDPDAYEFCADSGSPARGSSRPSSSGQPLSRSNAVRRRSDHSYPGSGASPEPRDRPPPPSSYGGPRTPSPSPYRSDSQRGRVQLQESPARRSSGSQRGSRSSTPTCLVRGTPPSNNTLQDPFQALANEVRRGSPPPFRSRETDSQPTSFRVPSNTPPSNDAMPIRPLVPRRVAQERAHEATQTYIPPRDTYPPPPRRGSPPSAGMQWPPDNRSAERVFEEIKNELNGGHNTRQEPLSRDLQDRIAAKLQQHWLIGNAEDQEITCRWLKVFGWGNFILE